MKNNTKDQKKVGTVSVISTVLTSMIGSSILIYPLIYKQYGIITTQVILTFNCLVNNNLCELVLIHTKKREKDQSEIVRRQMGSRWTILFNIASGLNTLFMFVVFFVFSANLVYKQIEFIGQHYGLSITSKDIFTFNIFSFQYLVIIAVLVQLPLMMIKDVTRIVQLARLGIIGILIFCTMICTKGILSLQEYHSKNGSFDGLSSKLNWHTNEIELTMGTVSQSLLICNYITPVFQVSEHPENNIRDIRIIHFLAYFFYSTIGILGYLAIMDRNPQVMQQNTIFDFYPNNDIIVFIITFFLIFKYFFTNIYFSYVLKLQIQKLTNIELDGPYYKYYVFVLSWGCLIIGLFNYQPVEIIAFCGAIFAYLLTYVFPISCHLICLYKKPCSYRQHQIDEEQQTLIGKEHQQQQQNIDDDEMSTCYKEQQQLMKTNYYLRMGFYVLIMTIGLMCSYQIIKRLVIKSYNHVYHIHQFK